MMHVTPVSVNRGPNQAGVSPPNPPPYLGRRAGSVQKRHHCSSQTKASGGKKICGEDLAADDLEKKFHNTQHTKHSVYYVKQASIASALPGQCMIFFVRMHFQQTYLRLAVMFTS